MIATEFKVDSLPKDVVDGKFTLHFIWDNDVKAYLIHLNLKDFSTLTRKAESNIRHMAKNGNRIRKLLTSFQDGRILIRLSEYFEYPFFTPGKSTLYHVFNQEGKKVWKHVTV